MDSAAEAAAMDSAAEADFAAEAVAMDSAALIVLLSEVNSPHAGLSVASMDSDLAAVVMELASARPSVASDHILGRPPNLQKKGLHRLLEPAHKLHESSLCIPDNSFAAHAVE